MVYDINKIDRFVSLLMMKNQMFTAYDITTYLRKHFPRESIKHDDVKGAISSINLSKFNYETTLIEINSNGDMAYLYKNISAKASDYNKTQMDVAAKASFETPATSVSIPAPAINPTNVKLNINVVKVNPDSRGRVTISNEIIKAANFSIGATVNVYVDESKNQILFTTRANNNLTCRSTLTVDKSFNLRVHKSLFWIKDFGMANLATYTTTPDLISVTLKA